MQSTANNSIIKLYQPSKQEFLNQVKQGQPFLINGVAEQWGAYQNWSNDYLADVCGNNLVPVETYPKDFYQNYNHACLDNYHTKQMQLKDYLGVINGDRNDDNYLYYMAQVDFPKYFPELLKDIIYPEYFRKKPKVTYLFFGFSDKKSTSATYLHFDEIHNVFVQIRGKKRFLLYPPTNYLSFYPPLEDNRYASTMSKVNPDEANMELFPNFPWQDKMEIILEAGDILYLPPFWWHHVTSVNENISLTFWYPPTLKDFFTQKGFFSSFLQIAPHVIPRIISSMLRNKLKK
jgi:Cupin-like domain